MDDSPTIFPVADSSSEGCRGAAAFLAVLVDKLGQPQVFHQLCPLVFCQAC